MSFDLEALALAVDQHGHVARVVVADVKGSAPREVGASMLVWRDGQSGTIGGGRLELDAIRAVQRATDNADSMKSFPLGPALGQCCGGSVVLLTEFYDATRLATLRDDYVLRNVGGADDVPLRVANRLKKQRNSGNVIEPMLADGWMLEPISKASRNLWIYGAGHVGRALVSVLAPLPEFKITWVDTSQDRYPADMPTNVTKLVATNPAEVTQYAPSDAEHLVMTYSHAFDLEICHQLLRHDFNSAGLIGSKSKWARFRTRLHKLGHTVPQIARICCPIGQTGLGKHPQAIAVGVAAGLLSKTGQQTSAESLVG
jgi:xanthine dehydrogenase accessory factor